MNSRFSLLTLATLLLIVMVSTSGCGPQQITGVSVKWRPFAELQPTFPSNTRPTMLYISQNDCHHCYKMKDTIFARPEIAKFINDHFDAVEINVDTDLPLMIEGRPYDYHPFHELLSIQGIPCYYFFASDGNIIGMLHGSQTVLDFKRILNYTVNGHFGKTPYLQWLQTDEAKLDTLYGFW